MDGRKGGGERQNYLASGRWYCGSTRRPEQPVHTAGNHSLVIVTLALQQCTVQMSPTACANRRPSLVSPVPPATPPAPPARRTSSSQHPASPRPRQPPRLAPQLIGLPVGLVAVRAGRAAPGLVHAVPVQHKAGAQDTGAQPLLLGVVPVGVETQGGSGGGVSVRLQPSSLAAPCARLGLRVG